MLGKGVIRQRGPEKDRTVNAGKYSPGMGKS